MIDSNIVLLYDGTKEGYFSAVYYAYLNKINPADILPLSGSQLNIAFQYEIVNTDRGNFKKVADKLKSISEGALSDIYFALASCDDKKGKIIFEFIRLLLKRGQDAQKMLSLNEVINFNACASRVKLESHRFLGFIRFKQTKNGLLYAQYHPDNDITAFIMPHFFKRLGKLPFVIHDLKRNRVGISDGKKFYTTFVNSDSAFISLHPDESDCVSLWKNYYDHVCIYQRRNLKQMKNYMPVRYWKNLPEKN